MGIRVVLGMDFIGFKGNMFNEGELRTLACVQPYLMQSERSKALVAFFAMRCTEDLYLREWESEWVSMIDMSPKTELLKSQRFVTCHIGSYKRSTTIT